MKLQDPQTGETLDVKHAVPTGKLRVEFARMAAELKTNDAQKRIMEAMIVAGTESRQEAVAALIQAGTVTVDDLVKANNGDSEMVEHNMLLTARMFQKAVDTRNMPAEWQARISREDFILEQNITEVEAFVNTFLRLVGIG